MANINLYDMYKRKLRKYGLNDSTRFRDAFVDAVNYSYNELNSQVFESVLVSPIGTFEEVIDTRLTSFTSITLTTDADLLTAIGSRETWALEYEFEITNSTNTFKDNIVISLGSVAVVVEITDNVLSLSVDNDTTVAATYTLATTTPKIKFSFDEDGNSLLIDGSAVTMTYTTGTSATPVPLGVINTWVISDTTGMIFKRYAGYSEETKIFEFPLDDDGATVYDLVQGVATRADGYTGDVVAGVWDNYYIESSSTLAEKYSTVLNAGLDFHLQDGGEWGLEPDVERERKWYGRGIKDGRAIYKQDVTYVNPLGI